ncbi:D-alanyl-D-alanine endopeptidase [Frondihabitans sp. 762G35]|uniref:D-alanyl-D-alanine carboxypeptidase family protein n=1 Tax=Frondihabitans sp. 762G35 TaxID=1446794 RepID=UPI000D220996|nr:D-alanyl-D-alanine carboxypeptidase [Frondihabitans sp. 762G35]ARC56839.1 D-alanyl-D-alanine endopeptidase [Frondihabitans sp. 762G35]
MSRSGSGAHRVRRRLVGALLAVVVVASAVYFPATLLAPPPTAAASVTSPAPPSSSPVDPTFPTYGATGVEALGFDDSLTTSGDTRPRSIASISKIVTALVVLDKRPLRGGSGPTITFTAADHALYDTYLAKNGEVAPMATGARLSERQTLQVALIKSANNYAGALSAWAFGSNDQFVAATRTWLRENHLSNTTLVEPTGLDPRNRSTAADLVRLGTLALQNPDVKAIVATERVSIPGVGVVTNSNRLLGVDGVEGIKTGTLDEAGACLLFASRETIAGREVTIVGVMLGGKDHDSLDTDVRRLLASVRAGFRTVTPVKKGDVVGTYSTKWGATARAEADATVSRLVYGAPAISTEVSTERLRSGTAGERVGTLDVAIAGEKVAVPLRLDRALTAPTAWWRITNPQLG